jgi:predicted transcriptional regulator
MSTYVIHPTDEQEKVVKAFLEALDISFEKEDEQLPDHVLAGIARGQAYIEAGRFTTYEEFKKKLLILNNV